MKKYYLISLLCLAIIYHNNNLKSQTKPYPVLPQVIKDTIFGKVVEDPYRFMENTNDIKVQKWLHTQTDKANKYLNDIKNRENILDKQKKNKSQSPQTWYVAVTENDSYFYLKKEIGENFFKLIYRKGFKGEEELLFSPENYKKELEKNYVINYMKPSWDGSKIVIGLTKNDEEFSELVIYDMKTRKILPEVITNCWPSDLGGISWLEDNSGFYYLHIPVIDKSSKDYILNSASVLYKLGTDPRKLNVVFSAKNNPSIKIKPEDFPIVSYKIGYGKLIIGRIGGATNFQDYYYAQTNKNGNVSEWKPLYKIEDKVIQHGFNGEEFYFLSAKNSPNYKLCKTNINSLNFDEPEILVKEDADAIISDLAITKSGIYFVKTKNGVHAQLYQFNNGVQKEISIPKQSGYIGLRSKSINSEDFWIYIDGWVSHIEKYRFNYFSKSFIEEDIYPAPKYPELDSVVVEEVEVVSHDGENVPLSIVYKNGVKLNGQNSVILGGYGAFGFSNSPYLYDHLLHWVREGGVFAMAHVRGGGEKGAAWHKGGFKQTKPNTWKDFIACTEYLIQKKYTNPNKIAIWGMSAGGILIARAITERPDLYKAAIISSGKINMLRSEFGPNGKNTIKEYGTVTDSSEFYALVEMDACQHIKKGTKYPSVLLQAGTNDARVPVWHSAKFAAGLQAATTSENPIILSVDFGGGHGLNSTEEQRNNSTIDIISFALWQTGHPDFQLKE